MGPESNRASVLIEETLERILFPSLPCAQREEVIAHSETVATYKPEEGSHQKSARLAP